VQIGAPKRAFFIKSALPSSLYGGRRFVRHIGLHHRAHLRAVAEGLDLADCAARYLGTKHSHEARAAHQQTVDAVRAIVRHLGEPWRLMSMSIQTTCTERPTLETFAKG
jgi:hypothetical protein